MATECIDYTVIMLMTLWPQPDGRGQTGKESGRLFLMLLNLSKGLAITGITLRLLDSGKLLSL